MFNDMFEFQNFWRKKTGLILPQLGFCRSANGPKEYCKLLYYIIYCLAVQGWLGLHAATQVIALTGKEHGKT